MLKKLKAAARNALYRVREHRLGPPTELELQHAAALRAEVARDTTVLDGPWGDNIARLQALVQTEDPRGFLNWDVVMRTMFIDIGRTLRPEIDHLRARADFATRWAPALKETRVGLPLPFMWYPPSSANLVHHAYHLARFEAATRTSLADYDTIVEFGAGYGSFARLAANLGFTGTFVMFDLPAFAALQRFFLGSAGYRGDHRWASSSSELDTILTTLPRERTLFVAMWSISEAPFAIREPVLASVRDFDAYLIGYQHAWEDMDNRVFFDDWRRSQPDVTWRHEPIAHMRGNDYLFGARS